ncbi:hypothetical protein MAR_005963 [Mya arenaria]|uniref:Seipin n=1 Tax=Mya arenaria TaxID=6604 RepID=A0ABY7D755_MYAAR|nr:hypothetical protein MAR_005963 [Mya arenaria]
MSLNPIKTATTFAMTRQIFFPVSDFYLLSNNVVLDIFRELWLKKSDSTHARVIRCSYHVLFSEVRIAMRSCCFFAICLTTVLWFVFLYTNEWSSFTKGYPKQMKRETNYMESPFIDSKLYINTSKAESVKYFMVEPTDLVEQLD